MYGNNQYLIPANTKKGQLIMGVFYPIDLIILCVGLAITFIALIVVSELGVGTWASIIAIIPGCIAGVLVFPFPNYHNVRTVIANAWEFYTTRQKYIWKGWCFEDGERDKK